MKLGHVELPVRDPLRALAFYRDVLGFQLEVNQVDRFIWMTSGDVTLLLRPGAEEDPPGDLARANLVLYSDDLTADVERVRASGVELSERSNCFHFRDTEGNWLQLVDPGGDHS